MAEYTPTTEAIKVGYVNTITLSDGGLRSRAEAFDRWLAQYDAAVRAQALRDAANLLIVESNDRGDWWDSRRDEYTTPVGWLRARADQIETETKEQD